MTEDLSTFVRVTYINALRSQGSAPAAFDRAVNILLDRLPSLSRHEARREVAMVLASQFEDISSK